MFKLLKYLKPYTWPIVITIILTFGQVMVNLELPDYMAKIINQGVIGGEVNIIHSIGFKMLVVSLLGAFCTIGASYLSARVSTGFSMNMREKVFAKVESFSLAEFNKFSTSSLITRTTNDIQQIQMVVFIVMRMMLMAPITGIGAIYKAYHTAPSMTWIIGIGIASLIGIIIILLIFAMPKFKVLQNLIDKLSLVTREILTGTRVIRAFNTEKKEEDKFNDINKELTGLNLFLNRMMALMEPLMMLIFNFTALAVIWVGARMIEAENLMIGDMIAFIQYSMQVLFSFTMISVVFIMLPRASVSGERIAEVINAEPTIKESVSPSSYPENIHGLLEFKNVGFKYPNANNPILNNISFVVNPGETVAIIGSTGSGKSTLVNLIPRFYDATSGSVLLNTIDVRELSFKDLYSKIGYVPQKGVLFSGKIKDNIKYGAPNASEEEIKKAAEIAQASEFIKKTDNGFESPISQGGLNLSGGQKQRLAIARAIIKKPELLIFDDSFSALDYKTDSALRQALEIETKNTTVLIVAQRITSIIHADKIIVLDKGSIVGIGNHIELLKTCSVYREIAQSQLSDDEV